MEKQVNNFEKMPILHPKAAGIDVGSSSHYVSIGQGEGQVKVLVYIQMNFIVFAGGFKPMK